MITKFKLYETLNKELGLGDYVICDEPIKGLSYFLSNNIGKYTNNINFDDYYIKYENIPIELEFYFSGAGRHNTRIMRREEIKYWSEDKKDLEELLAAKKYNL